MTPKQQQQMESDFKDFRAQFINELARELSELVYHKCKGAGRLYLSTTHMIPDFKTVLERRLPDALQVMRPVRTITLED